jgi:hypothetical protein
MLLTLFWRWNLMVLQIYPLKESRREIRRDWKTMDIILSPSCTLNSSVNHSYFTYFPLS